MSPRPIGKWSLSSSHSILSLQSLPAPGSPHCLWSGGERERSKGNMLLPSYYVYQGREWRSAAVDVNIL